MKCQAHEMHVRHFPDDPEEALAVPPCQEPAALVYESRLGDYPLCKGCARGFVAILGLALQLVPLRERTDQ